MKKTEEEIQEKIKKEGFDEDEISFDKEDVSLDKEDSWIIEEETKVNLA